MYKDPSLPPRPLVGRRAEASATPAGCHTHQPGNQCDTLAGSLKAMLGDPQGVEGVGKGLCTSVTASRMTDAYGAGTHKGCCPIPQGHAILSGGSDGLGKGR